MLNTKSFLAVDCGAGSLKLAEFVVNEAGGLSLKQFGLRALGAEGAQEATREAALRKALTELLAEKGIKARNVNVCAPGFHVFSKFVKLPPVETAKVAQIIRYEAQQNVPFPLEEVVWDYQILGQTPGGELEVLLVAIKSDIVEGLFTITEAAGLRLQLCDVSPAALCNMFRYNYGDLEDCTMLLDIGAKTSNLLFFEKGKVFARSINIGANSITQDFAQEAKLKFDQAERIKIAEGFVSLGGAYEEPENPHQAAISKIARQFMTRLHIQVNQTMQFYRGQQGGSAPVRLFLAGGASIMPYTAQFFAEKLNVPVEYLNPFRNVQIDPGVNLEELARVAHSMGEVVGLGLRNLAHCPVELNLMPESTRRWQRFNEKKPYFIATVFSLVAVVFATGWLMGKLAEVKQRELEQLDAEVQPKLKREADFKRAYKEFERLRDQVNQYTDWMEERFYWVDVLGELRQALMTAERKMKERLGTETGVWIESMTAQVPAATPTGLESPFGPGQMPGMPMPGIPDEYLRRYGIGPMGMAPTPVPVPGEPGMGVPQPVPGEMPAPPAEGMPGEVPGVPGVPGEPGAVAGPPTSEPGTVSVINLTLRAVSMTAIAAAANTDLAFAVLNELKTSERFDPQQTQFVGNISADEPPGTFTFSVAVKLKRALKLQ